MNRYSKLNRGGSQRVMPRVDIPMVESDIVIRFDSGSMRMDMLSYKYYGDANYGWLIMLSNPHLPSLEFQITDGSQMRIPYPLSSALARFDSALEAKLASQQQI